MIVRNLSQAAVRAMARIDLADVTEEPASLIEAFDFHGCDCGVASFVGQPPWERHNGGDELLHVLSGEIESTLRENGRDVVRTLRAGDLAIIPRGAWHRNHAHSGVTLLYMTPRDGNDHSWDAPVA